MIEVMRAKIEDAQKILEIKLRAFESEIKLYNQSPPGIDSLEKQKKAIQNNFYFKIMENGELIGGICIIDLGASVFLIGSIFIDTNEQNMGYGTQALKKVEDLFPQARKWVLETPYLSYRNHHFYETSKYKKVNEYVPEYAKGTNFRLFNYEKTVTETSL